MVPFIKCKKYLSTVHYKVKNMINCNLFFTVDILSAFVFRFLIFWLHRDLKYTSMTTNITGIKCLKWFHSNLKKSAICLLFWIMCSCWKDLTSSQPQNLSVSHPANGDRSKRFSVSLYKDLNQLNYAFMTSCLPVCFLPVCFLFACMLLCWLSQWGLPFDLSPCSVSAFFTPPDWS